MLYTKLPFSSERAKAGANEPPYRLWSHISGFRGVLYSYVIYTYPRTNNNLQSPLGVDITLCKRLHWLVHVYYQSKNLIRITDTYIQTVWIIFMLSFSHMFTRRPNFPDKWLSNIFVTLQCRHIAYAIKSTIRSVTNVSGRNISAISYEFWMSSLGFVFVVNICKLVAAVKHEMKVRWRQACGH